LRRRLAEDEAFAAAFDAVMIEADKLACYCPDLHCHTAVMVEEWGRRLMEAADATGT